MYIPKSQILTNQYTNGNELVYLSNSQPYTGYYYILSNNTIFSGKNPNDGESKQLIFISDLTNKRDEFTQDTKGLEQTPIVNSNTVYDSVRKSKNIPPPPSSLIEPERVKPSPGYPSFTRYFLKRVSSLVYIETSKEDYNNIVNKLPQYNFAAYLPFTILWVTKGENREQVFLTNKQNVSLQERRQKLYGLTNYFKDFSEYFV